MEPSREESHGTGESLRKMPSIFAASRLGTTPIGFRIALGNLGPEEYPWQIDVLDPNGHRAALWHAPVMPIRSQ
jgi:hypothetical protein